MSLLQQVPAKWWAVLIGVAFGSLALIALNGPKDGYLKTISTACLTAPLLSILAGGILPQDASMELAATIGGVVTLGGMAVIASVAKMAPSLITAGLTGVARSYLEINPTPEGVRDEVTRRREDGTPDQPNAELDDLVSRIDPPKENPDA